VSDRLGHRRRLDEERGAVLMIAAICLVVLLGMLVLVFDLGRGVAIRRSMVSASDSAALAAAQQCVMGNGTSAASAAAAELVASNKTGATVTSFSAPECDAPQTMGPKFVTVQSTFTMEYFFAQIFGFESGPVTTQAIAQYGPVMSVLSPVPIRISESGLTSCVAAGEDGACYLGFDNSDSGAEANSQWGILNFPQGWPVDSNNDNCTSNAGGFAETDLYIQEDPGAPSFEADVGHWVQEDGAAFVCAAPGSLGNAVIDSLIVKAGSEDPYLTFPVMSDTIPPITTPGQEAFPIVRFAVLEVLGAWHGAEAREHCTFPDTVNDNSLFCIQLNYEEDKQIVSGGIPSSDPIYDGTVVTVRLVK
jgi:hypothetical protein